MKTIFRFASLLAAAVMLFASCGETGTGTENPTPDGPATKGELTLDVDNLIIQAGVDQAKLTVKLDGNVISDGVIIFGNDNKIVDLGADFIFTSETAGTYTFWANYQTFNSNVVTVKVVNTPVPATPEDPQPSNTSFVRRLLLTKFTGQDCQFCPNATASIHKFFEEHELAPYVVKAEAHTFNANDPAYFAGPFYGVQNFPTVCVDWAVITTNVDYNTISGVIEDRYEEEAAKAGISVNSVCENGTITFKVCVKAAEAGQYRVGAWLLEDNIIGQQKGAPLGEETLTTTASSSVPRSLPLPERWAAGAPEPFCSGLYTWPAGPRFAERLWAAQPHTIVSAGPRARTWCSFPPSYCTVNVR